MLKKSVILLFFCSVMLVGSVNAIHLYDYPTVRIFPSLNGVSLFSSNNDIFSLGDAVKSSNNNDIIYIPTNLSTVNNVIVIDHNLTIEGVDGLTLLDLSNNGDGLFVIAPNCTLNLSNVKVSGESLRHSLILNKGEVNINNCLFENNTGTGVDGLIINNVFNSSLCVNNSRFLGNNAGDTSRGGVINMNYSNSSVINNSIFNTNHGYLGGVLYLDLYDNALLNIVNCSFNDNTAYKGGAIYNKDSHLNLKDVTFCGNNVTNSGGGVYNNDSDDLTILDCVFNGNNALYGGGVYATTAVSSVGHSNFTNNHARSGGAIYNKDGRKQTYVYNRTNFNGNGYDGTGSYGGAITINNGGLVLSRSTLNNNSAENGGAVYIVDSGKGLSFKDCVFNDNGLKSVNSQSLGGAVYIKNSYLLIKGVCFNKSTAYYGGALYVDGGLIQVDDDDYKTEFLNNTANCSGGAIFSLRSDLMLSGNVDFIDNKAVSGDGGAINTDSKSNIAVEKASFQSNSACSDGGAIKSSGSVTNGGVSIKILSSNFTNNNASRGSGVFLYEGSYALMDNCSFTLNNGNGAFYNARGSHVKLNNTIFNGNICEYNIVHDYGNDLSICNSMINGSLVINSMVGCPNEYYRSEIHIT